MRTPIGTVTKVSIKFEEKEERGQKDGYKYEQNTKHTNEYGDKRA